MLTLPHPRPKTPFLTYRDLTIPAHSDLGLLSLVLGSTPGLEVWNRASSSWLLIEKADQQAAATLLVGRQLERLSNGRYQSGKHRVCAYPSNTAVAPAAAQQQQPPPPPSTTTITAASTSTPQTPQFSLKSLSSSSENYRYSIVFVLRAHWPVPVDSSLLTTPITGTFASPMSNMTAKDLFVSIEKMCYNVNAERKERDKQRRRLVHGGDGRRNSKRGSRLIE